MKNGIFKKIISIMLAFVITVTSVIVYKPVPTYAVAVVDDAYLIWQAIVGTAVGYAGYKSTKTQTKSLTSEYIDTWKKFDELTKDIPYYSDAKAFKEAVEAATSGTAAEWITKTIAGTSAEKFEENVKSLRDSWTVIKGGGGKEPSDDDSDDDKLNDKEYGAMVALGSGLTVQAKLIKLVSGSIKEMIEKKNEEASHSQSVASQYDWKSLNFETGYDVLPKMKVEDLKDICSKSAYQTLSELFTTNKTALFLNTDEVYKYNILVFDKYQGDNVQYGTNDNIALVTFHNYEDDTWSTSYITEYRLYTLMKQFNQKLITYSELKNSIEEYVDFTNISEYQFAPGGDLYCSPASFGNCNFKTKYCGSPFKFAYKSNFNFNYGGEVVSSSAKVINLSYTMNYFYLNFTGAESYSASCSADNGHLIPDPPFQKSNYTNTAEQIDNAGNIEIDQNAEYNSSDDQLTDIAKDNDLDLDKIADSNENIEENTSSILDQLTSIPKSIYNYFKNILNKILNAVLNNPTKVGLEISNVISSPLQSIINAIQNLTVDAVLSLDSAWNNVPESVKSLVTNNSSILNAISPLTTPITNMCEYLRQIFINGTQELTLGNIVTQLSGLPLNDILTAIQSMSVPDITSIPQDCADAISISMNKLFVPDSDTIKGYQADLNDTLEKKLPGDTYVKLLTDVKEIKSERAPDVYIDYKDNHILFISWNNFYNYYDNWKWLIEGFFFLILIALNIYHIYKVIRGNNLTE